MTTAQWDSYLDGELDRVRGMLGTKAKEYAQGGDRLHNFRRAAAMKKITAAEALDGFLLKHEVSYRDMISLVQGMREHPLDGDDYIPAKWSRAVIDEKFTDIINYFILQKAVFLQDHCSDAEGTTT